MLKKGKFSTLKSPAHGGGTILEKGKVCRLEENTLNAQARGGKTQDPGGGENPGRVDDPLPVQLQDGNLQNEREQLQQAEVGGGRREVE